MIQYMSSQSKNYRSSYVNYTNLSKFIEAITIYRNTDTKIIDKLRKIVTIIFGLGCLFYLIVQ